MPKHAVESVEGFFTDTRRRWLYALVSPLLKVATVYGLLTETQAGVWAGLAAAFLGFGVDALATRNTPSTTGDQ